MMVEDVAGWGVDPNRPLLPERAEPQMTGEQYYRAITRLGLSQVRAARFFGLSDKKGQRIARGDIEVPPVISYLLKLMLKHDVMPGDLDRRFDPEIAARLDRPDKEEVEEQVRQRQERLEREAERKLQRRLEKEVRRQERERLKKKSKR